MSEDDFTSLFSKAEEIWNDVNLQRKLDDMDFDSYELNENLKPYRQSNINFYGQQLSKLQEIQQNLYSANIDNIVKVKYGQEIMDVSTFINAVEETKERLDDRKSDFVQDLRDNNQRTGRGTSLIDEGLWTVEDTKHYLTKLEYLFDKNDQEKSTISNLKNAYFTNNEDQYVKALEVFYNTRNLINGTTDDPVERAMSFNVDVYAIASKLSDFRSDHKDIKDVYTRLGITPNEASLMHKEAMMSALDLIRDRDLESEYDDKDALQNFFESHVRNKTIAMMVEYKRQKALKNVITQEFKFLTDHQEWLQDKEENYISALQKMSFEERKAMHGVSRELKLINRDEDLYHRIRKTIEDQIFINDDTSSELYDKRSELIQSLDKAEKTNRYAMLATSAAIKRNKETIAALAYSMLDQETNMEIEDSESKEEIKQNISKLQNEIKQSEEVLETASGLYSQISEFVKIQLSHKTMSTKMIQKLIDPGTKYSNLLHKSLAIHEVIKSTEEMLEIHPSKRLDTQFPGRIDPKHLGEDPLVYKALMEQKKMIRVLDQIKSNIILAHNILDPKSKNEDEANDRMLAELLSKAF